MATLQEFLDLNLRVGKIIAVDDHELARKPMYKLTVDLGPEVGQRTLVAGVKEFYSKEQLLGRKIVVVANLEPKKIAGIESQGMLLVADFGDGIAILSPDKDVPEGTMVH